MEEEDCSTTSYAQAYIYPEDCSQGAWNILEHVSMEQGTCLLETCFHGNFNNALGTAEVRTVGRRLSLQYHNRKTIVQQTHKYNCITTFPRQEQQEQQEHWKTLPAGTRYRQEPWAQREEVRKEKTVSVR